MGQKKLALSMRGGGARCGAYIGVLKALKENEIEVSYLLASSAGAIIATAYAVGCDLGVLAEEISKLNLKKFVGLQSLATKSVLSELKFRRFFSELLNKYAPGILNIEQTKIPLCIQLTNLSKLENEYWDNGPLARTASASMAVPFLFSPVRIGADYYCDGDLTSTYGVEFLKSRGYEVVLGMTCGFRTGVDPNQFSTKFELPLLASLKQMQKFDQKLNPVDLLLDNLGTHIEPLDFAKTPEVADYGYRVAMAHMPEIKKLVHHHSLWSFLKP